MSGASRWLRFWRSDHATEVAEELEHHLESAVAEEMALGHAPDEARRRAAARFGNVEGVRSTLHGLSRDREQRTARREWRMHLALDLRFAWRQVRHSPAFSLVVLATLGLGIGANVAIFSLVHAILLKPLPYDAADRLVDLRQRNGANAPRVVTYGSFETWRQEAHSFDALGATEWTTRTLTGEGEPLRLRGHRTTAGYWKAIHAAPVVGRYFETEEDPTVVVLSYPLWLNAFRGDSSVVGKTALFDGVSYRIAAVAPTAYSLTPDGAAFWVPFAMTERERGSYGDHELAVTGRLRAGVSLARAVAELDAIEQRLAKTYVDAGIEGAVVATPLQQAIAGAARTQFLTLFAAVGVVLLIACGNIASLLLARAMVRQPEIAVRRALGASRGRLVTQLLVESLFLAAGGVVAGLALGWAMLRFLLTIVPPNVARAADVQINLTVLAFSVGVGLFSALLFGLLPAFRTAGASMHHAIRDGGREGRGTMSDRMRGAFIVTEIALALVLVTGAGLMLRSTIALQQVDPGFDPDNVITARISLPPARYADDAAVVAGFTRIADAAQAIPGVAAAGFGSRIPIGSSGADCGVKGDDVASDNESASFRSATPGYFDAMGMRVIQGRGFTTADRTGSAPVAVITASLAKSLFGDVNPVGHRVTQCLGIGSGYNGSVTREVVGVIGNIHANGKALDVTREVYYPTTQFYERSMVLVVRGTVPVAGLLPAIRIAVGTIDPSLALGNVMTMEAIMARATAAPRFTTLLLILLGSAGLLLAATGIYGVISYLVTQRTREIGIRMALGASAGQVRGAVLRRGLALAILGVVIGEGIAMLATPVLASAVYGVTPRDPVTFVGVGAVFLAVAALASAIPARRATRVDPIRALRG